MSDNPEDRENQKFLTETNTLDSVAKSTYHDADDFDREVVQGEELDISDEFPNTDYIKVYHKASGAIYRMTETQAIIRGIGAAPPSDVKLPLIMEGEFAKQPSTTKVVHILHQGSTFCGRPSGRPVDWPKGHEWVSKDHVDSIPKGSNSGVTCGECFDRLMELRQ